jgi:RimJ/RimL family protein N-acetyltransferase
LRDRLLLRRWREEDLDPYARICADQEAMRYTRAGTPLTREQTKQRVAATKRHWKERGFGLWAVEEKATGAFIGRIGLLYHEDWPEGEHKTEVGWLLDRSFWRRGLATEGAVASVRFGFEKLGLERIISIIRPENAASRQVAERAGLTFGGGARWRGMDVVWYTRDRSDWEARS